jgi:hypothetical protein
MDTSGIKKYERAYDFSASVTQVLIVGPMDRIIIDGGFIDVPSNMTVTLEFAYSDGVFGTPITGITNQKYPLDNLQVQQIKVTKTGGAGTRIWAAFSQGTGGAVFTLPSTTTINIGTVSGIVTVVGNVAAGATDSGNPIKTGGVYNAADPVYTNGQRGDFQITTQGWHKSQEMRVDHSQDNVNYVVRTGVQLFSGVPDYSPNEYINIGTLTAAVVRAGPANLYSVLITSTEIVTTYLLFHDRNSAAVNADGVAPKKIVPIPANGYVVLDKSFFLDGGCVFLVAIAACISSSPASYSTTGITANKYTVQIHYK